MRERRGWEEEGDKREESEKSWEEGKGGEGERERKGEGEGKGQRKRALLFCDIVAKSKNPFFMDIANHFLLNISLILGFPLLLTDSWIFLYLSSF